MKTLKRLPLAIGAALCIAADAHAVRLGTNGLGQALIFPYYTVRTSPGGNAFNTYLSVVNATTAAKALRVRLREGRMARTVLDFNLYLSPNDAWAGAVVPTVDGGRLITTDSSCTDPPFMTGTSGPAFLPLTQFGYLGDGFGDTLDRTREGYVEIIEMATLTGASAAAVTHNSAGVPNNCGAIRSGTAPAVAPPTSGLSGTLTLINVNSGQDFTLDAVALENLTTRAFFHPAGDSDPSFASTEIDPVSMVVTGGHAYRSLWTRPQDAVSAVLMHSAWTGEFVLDNATFSLTDFVATLPTRHLYVTTSAVQPPFTVAARAPVGVGEPLRMMFFNREEQHALVTGSDFTLPPTSPAPSLSASAVVATIRNNATHMPVDATRSNVFGSTNFINVMINTGFQNGWMDFQITAAEAANALRSLPTSTRTNVVTGEVTTASHAYHGVPLVGFSARSFSNGTLQCAGADSCQGNYGGAFALKYRRRITIQ